MKKSYLDKDSSDPSLPMNRVTRPEIPASRVIDAGIAAHVGRLEQALHSIAKNTCCSNCKEASLVARAALASYAGLAIEAATPDPKSNPFIGGTDLSEAYEKGWRDALAASRDYNS